MAIPLVAPEAARRAPPAAAWGFTLLEIILVIILAMVIAVVLGLIASQGIRGGLAQAERRDMVKEGMEALEKMTRDIRMMGDSAGAVGGLNDCGPADPPPNEGNEPDGDVEYVSDTIFNFRHNGLSSTVCYFLESGTLWRAQGCAGACSIAACAEQAVARNVVNSDPFDYYRYNGTKLADPNVDAVGLRCQVWRIEIELQLRRGTSTTDPMRNVTLRTSVFPRDLAER